MIYAWLKNKVPHTKYVKQRKNGDMLIVCSEDLAIYYFNKTAAFFLREIDGVKNIDEIKEMFIKKFDVDEAVLEKDLVEVVRDLQWKKIIVLGG